MPFKLRCRLIVRLPVEQRRDDFDRRAILITGGAGEPRPAAELPWVHDHETSHAGEFALPLLNDTLDELGVGNRRLILVLFIVAVPRRDAILQNGVEIGLNIVGIEVVIVIVVFGSPARPRRCRGVVFFVLVVAVFRSGVVVKLVIDADVVAVAVAVVVDITVEVGVLGIIRVRLVYVVLKDLIVVHNVTFASVEPLVRR